MKKTLFLIYYTLYNIYKFNLKKIYLKALIYKYKVVLCKCLCDSFQNHYSSLGSLLTDYTKRWLLLYTKLSLINDNHVTKYLLITITLISLK